MTAEELERLQYIDRQQQLFDEARPVLVAEYLHEYVVFEDGQVLDHDVDRVRLAERVYRKYGCRDLIMQRVTPEKTLYHIGGFQMMRDSV
jgi:predicted Zn-dependent peptidase